MTHIRVGTHSDVIGEHIFATCSDFIVDLDNVKDIHRAKGIPVLLNGCLLGYTNTEKDALSVIEIMLESRRKFTIPFDTTIVYDNNTVIVDSDSGCLMRPLLVGKNLHKAKGIIDNAQSTYNIWDVLIS